MIMKYNLFDIGGKIIKDDEYGLIRENRELGNIWINSILLYKEKSTKKFCYLKQDTIYVFVDGKGIFELGKEIIYVSYNDIVYVPHGAPHKIINNGDIHMKILAFKEKVDE